jgi:hypothetical protein
MHAQRNESCSDNDFNVAAPQLGAEGADGFCFVYLHRLVASMQLTATMIKCIVHLQNQRWKKKVAHDP